MSKSKVYLVGAGPGDPELITLKGYRLISRADVILHDHLIPPELLELARPGAEVISVGKFASEHTLPQDEINNLLLEKARAGNIVVRLKGGDPYLFGRGGEEAEACAEAGVRFEVVPGITSALAAACYAGIPPTHRDYTPNLAIITGHRREDKKLDIPKAGTLIFLMGVANVEKIVNSLLKQGWPRDTKIAAIEKGTRYDQRVVKGTLDDFLEVAEKAQLRKPAIFIVGKVVGLQEKLDWFGTKPRILLPGTHPEKYKHLGTIIHRPFIKLVPLEDYTAADAVLKDLAPYDWIVFTSTNGVKFFFERLNAIGLDTRALGSNKVAAIGATTTEALREFGVLADMQPELESSAGLLEEFGKVGVKGCKILLVKPEVGSPALFERLTAAGAEVEVVVVYKNIDVEPEPTDFDYIDQILFTSASTVRAFIKRFKTVPPGPKVYCLGQPTLDEAAKHNIKAEILPPEK
ncbi:MAG TPA: uroporphyrinogen-III C-methyltransferase [Sedimentisphaerales bacterium]|nr:uroporphyrinogen-III C-methyltransferase [Sedimentisphaerales bacterium]